MDIDIRWQMLLVAYIVIVILMQFWLSEFSRNAQENNATQRTMKVFPDQQERQRAIDEIRRGIFISSSSLAVIATAIVAIILLRPDWLEGIPLLAVVVAATIGASIPALTALEKWKPPRRGR
ncbi:MAG: hypothetical protein ACRDAX_09940 [Propionibacteriaceae bacterium]